MMCHGKPMTITLLLGIRFRATDADSMVRSRIASIASLFCSVAPFTVQWSTRRNIEPQNDIGTTAVRLSHSTPLDSSDNADEDKEDDELTTPYENRSLAWTNRYRKLLPYEWARKEAMKLGLRSKDDWDDYLQYGKVYQNKYLPNRPDEMYVDDRVSWEEFLGILRGYEDTRYIVQKVLQIKTMKEYQQFIAADTKRAEGLRIPCKPDIVYRDKGWISWNRFLVSDKEGMYIVGVIPVASVGSLAFL
jgi:hypothetical protein